jgi:hypothetical protein
MHLLVFFEDILSNKLKFTWLELMLSVQNVIHYHLHSFVLVIGGHTHRESKLYHSVNHLCMPDRFRDHWFVFLNLLVSYNCQCLKNCINIKHPE